MVVRGQERQARLLSLAQQSFSKDSRRKKTGHSGHNGPVPFAEGLAQRIDRILTGVIKDRVAGNGAGQDDGFILPFRS